MKNEDLVRLTLVGAAIFFATLILFALASSPPKAPDTTNDKPATEETPATT